MPVPGQAPAANQRPTSAPSVVMAPGLSPVQKIEALLQAEKPVEPGERMVQEPQTNPPAPQEQPQSPASEAPPAEEPAAGSEAEPTAPTKPDQNQQVEGSEASPDADTHEIPLDTLEAIPLDVTYKGDDGQDVTEKIPVKELREGYMRQKDYSRKTAEVARQREAVSEEVRKGVESERAAYFQTLQSLQDVVISSIDTELKSANWSELAANDPATYVRLDNRRKEIDRTLGEIQSKQQEVMRQRDAERAQVRQQQAKKSVETLEQKIPGWNDALYQKLMKAASDTYGYKPDEVGSWIDHRAFEVLHDAMQFRQTKAVQASQAPLKDKRVVVVPKVVRPGPAAQNTASQERGQKAMETLRTRGTVDAAAAVIKSRLG